MTRSAVLKKAESIKALALLIATVSFGVFLSGEMSGYIIDGMELAVRCVIPSSFPFMIITDLYTHYGTPEMLSIPGEIFCRLIGIKPYMLGTFICGNVGGFPIGAKMAADLYSTNKQDKDALERLIPMSSNPSAAFVIGGVGLGMFKDVRIGFLLLLSLYLSMFLCALLTKRKYTKIIFHTNKTEQNYSFVASVKQAGSSCISLISFISIFSATVGLVKNHIKNKAISYSLITLLEVTNAVKIFSDSSQIPLNIGVGLAGFALGFGGLSVMMQSTALLSGSDLKMKKYLFFKLLQGALCGCISLVLFLIFK